MKKNPFRDMNTETIKKSLAETKEEVEGARLALRVLPDEIIWLKDELKNRKDPDHERFECSASPECNCENCLKENVKMD